MEILVIESFTTSDLVSHECGKLIVNSTLKGIVVDNVQLRYNFTPTNGYTRIESLLEETKDGLEESRIHGIIVTSRLSLLVITQSTSIIYWILKTTNAPKLQV